MWDSPPNIFWCQNFGTELETEKIKYSGLEIPASNGENLKIPFPEQEVTRMENFTLYHFAWNVLFFSRMNAHTRTHTHMDTLTHAHPHTRTHLLAHKSTHTCTLSHSQTNSNKKPLTENINSLTFQLIRTHSHIPTNTNTHAPTHPHTRTHTYTLTHKHSHTLHSLIFFPTFFVVWEDDKL